MTRFVSPSGEFYEIDNPADPAVAAWIRQNNMREQGVSSPVLKDVAKSATSGGYEALARAPLVLADLTKLAVTGMNKVRPGIVNEEIAGRIGSQPWIDAFRGSPQDKWLQENLGLDMVHEPQTTAGRYTKAGTSGAVGALTLGGLRSADKAVAAIGGLGGTAGELGYDISRGFDETKPGSAAAALAAALVASGGANAVRQGMSPNLNQQVYNATRSMPPGEWDDAATSLKNFKRSGSQSYTLADVPELQPRIGGLAAGMSNTAGGDVLRYRLSPQVRRDVDIPNLLRKNIDELGVPPFDPREFATLLAKRGDERITKAIQARSVARDGNLQGNVDERRLLAATNRYVRMPRLAPTNQSEGQRTAFDAAEAALVGKDALKTPMMGQVVPPVLNLQSLSQNVKAIEKIPLNPASNPSGAVRNYQATKAREAAELALDRASRGSFRKAMDQYKLTTENLVEPLERGLPGTIRKASTGDDLIKRLREVPPDRLRGELNTLGVTSTEAKMLARLVGDTLKPIKDKTDAIGSASAKDRAVYEALLDYGDPNLLKEQTNRLNVVDSLAKLHSEYGTDRAVNLHLGKNPVSTLVNPFGEGSFRARLGRSAKEAQELSDLLSNPTPENLTRLREMSKTNPNAKRALEWAATMAGSAQSSAVHRQGK